MNDPVSLQELHEIHEYIRHVLAVYVTWFTFFLAFLFGAMAWALRAAIDKKGHLTTTSPFFFVLCLFALQLVFGIWLTSNIRSDVSSLDERALSLLKSLAETQNSARSYVAKSPVPPSLHFAFELMQWVLVSQLAFWLAVGAYVFANRGKRVFSAASSDA